MSLPPVAPMQTDANPTFPTRRGASTTPVAAGVAIETLIVNLLRRR
jgi:hypothetical protein